MNAERTLHEERKIRTENSARVAWLMLRGVFGWRFAAAAGLLALGIAAGLLYVFKNNPELSPSQIHVLLGRVFAIFVLILAAPLLPDERSRGTLEILWLACGSFRRLLRWKTFVLTVAATCCIVPVVLVSDWYLGGRLAEVKEIVFLVTQSILIATWMFYVGSYLPQPWAGGLVAAAVFLAVEWPLSSIGYVFNPFMQLYKTGNAAYGWWAYFWNRALVVGLAVYFYMLSSRRIRRWLA